MELFDENNKRLKGYAAEVRINHLVFFFINSVEFVKRFDEWNLKTVDSE